MNSTAPTESDFTNKTQTVIDKYYIIPRDIDTLLEQLIYFGIIPLLSIAGVILNSFCCAMFCKLQRKSCTVVMLIALSLNDIVVLTISCFYAFLISSEIYGVPFSFRTQTEISPYIWPYAMAVPPRIGNSLTLFISIERLLCVSIPLKIRKYSSTRNACFTIIISYMLPVLLCLPNLFYFRTETIYSNYTRTYLTILKATEFRKNVALTNAIYTSQEILFRFLPVFGVMLTSTITVFVVKTADRRRKMMADGKDMRGRQSYESKVTHTLLVKTFVFVLCNLPVTLLRMIIFINLDGDLTRSKNNIYELASSITFVFLTLNSVINFFVYYKTSSVYNSEFKKLLYFKQRKNAPDPNISTVQLHFSNCS